MNRIPFRSFLKDAGSAAGDLFLPRTCVVCGRPLLRRERHICLPCDADLPLTAFWAVSRNPMADRLNALIQRRLASSGLVAAGHEDQPYAFAAALFYYNSQAPYRKIPQALKYHGAVGIGRFFGRRLGLALARAPHLQGISVVVPVPLHWTRRRQRGYNQAEIIARAVGAALGVPTDARLLRRRRRTRTQTRLTVVQKAANVGGAFAVRPRRLTRLLSATASPVVPGPSSLMPGPAGSPPGRLHILLVDDVFTTGATLEACHAALREALSDAGIDPGRVRISVATLGYVGRL